LLTDADPRRAALAAFRAGRLAEALPLAEMATREFPEEAGAHNLLGVVLRGLARPADAAIAFAKAARLKPDDPGYAFNLGLARTESGDHERAIEAFDLALARRPDWVPALVGSALAARNTGRLGEAIRLLERAVALAPEAADIVNNLGLALIEAGRSSEATTRFRQAMALSPDAPDIASNLLFALDDDESLGTLELQAHRRDWARRFADPLATRIDPHGNRPDPDRRLRVGYVSADFCRHSAAMLFGALILERDATSHDVVCYSATREADDLTRAFRQAADLWREIIGLADEEFATLIRRDGIDILVDLSGHSGGNRLGVFARKPAPVQVTGFGYPTGTGLRAFDALVADRHLIPGEERSFYTEPIADLPSAFVFEPPADAPEVAPLPLAQGGPPVFACFNRLSKLSAAARHVFIEILEATGGTLILKDASLDDPVQVTALKSSFGSLADRLVLLGRTSRRDHLAAWRAADIALDPFPQNGGLSSLEALWMGVPVVSLRGRKVAARGGAAILDAAGLAEWIAETPADYVAITRRAAADPVALAVLRAELRGRIAASPLVDRAGFLRAVEAIYRGLWRSWCAERLSGA